MQENSQTSLLHECRQIMTKRMRVTITGMLNEIDETLLKMAQNRGSNIDESACYDAVREIRLKRTEIKLRFERRFINLFENGIKHLTESDKQSLIGNEETQREYLFNNVNREESISIENYVGAVRKNCGQALLDLDKRVSALLDAPEDANPMQPAFVFEAFRDACWDIKSGEEVKLMMFRIFERRLATELQDIYQDINKLLEDIDNTAGIKPELEEKLEILVESEQHSVLLRYETISRIEKRLAGHEVPEFVRSFLLKHWRIFMENIYLKYTENSIAWNAARQTMDDLILSVDKISGLYDRQRQVQILPSLLFRLVNGMKVISMNESDIDIFLKKLKNHQLQYLDKSEAPLVEAISDEVIKSVSISGYKYPH